MKRLILAVAGVLATLVVVITARTLMLASRQLESSPLTPLKLDEVRAIEHLRQALRIKTISHQDSSKVDGSAFSEFHAFLERAFPRIHATLERETVSKHSLLYTWKGTEPGRKPMLMLAHIDVVPADSADSWTHPPFSGDLADGYVWGRGALDDKGSVLGILEAIEALLAEGFKPSRTVHVALGHDEEVGGENGAIKIAALMKARGIRPEFCLDEGMAVVEGVVPGIDRPVALIGVAEKGYLTLELTVEDAGGHSSQPPKQTALGVLSAAVTQLEANPLPASIRGPVRQMFEYLGPEMPLTMRTALANLWLLEGLVKSELDTGGASAATLRTTTAVTIMNGGTKENVLPTRARAVVNFRTMPGDSADDVIAHVKATVDDDRVSVAVLGRANEASPVADTNSPSFELINRTIRQAFPEAIVAPALDLAATDSRHYTGVAENAYRFGPLWLKPEDLGRIHGKDERISSNDHLRSIRFFAQLIRNASETRP